MKTQSLMIILSFLIVSHASADGLVNVNTGSAGDYISTTAPSTNYDPDPTNQSPTYTLSFSPARFLFINDPHVNILLQNQTQLVNSTSQTLSFNLLSGDGTQLETQIVLQNPVFSQLFVDGADNVRIRAEWKLFSCDGVSIDSDFVDPATLDVDSLVDGLRKVDFSRYMNCSFKLQSEACSEISNGFDCVGSYTMDLKDTGAIEFEQDGYAPFFLDSEHPQSLFTPTHPVDTARQSAAQDAAADFVSHVKDYGNTIVTLKNANATDRHAALSAWIGKNGSTLTKDLSTVEQNLGSTSTVTKLNIVTSINQAYGYVHYLEGQIQGSFMLDQVVNAGN
jgi:hypothetical protein